MSLSLAGPRDSMSSLSACAARLDMFLNTFSRIAQTGIVDPEEVAAIERFVKKGGGLLLIGDPGTGSNAFVQLVDNRPNTAGIGSELLGTLIAIAVVVVANLLISAALRGRTRMSREAKLRD